ncbi:MAG: IPExxxVDY family protein [Gillisia sp.]
MLSHKLQLEDVEEDYLLIAIHSSVEEYKIAYYLNKFLQIGLKRSAVDVDFNHGTIQASYPLFYFKEKDKYRSFFLVKNKHRGAVKKVVSSGSLFIEEEENSRSTYLIPEHKDVDYFLKIEDDSSLKERELLQQIASIPNIITSYSIDPNILKSKNNLIFE